MAEDSPPFDKGLEWSLWHISSSRRPATFFRRPADLRYYRKVAFKDADGRTEAELSMQIVFRSGELEHGFESDSAGGRILAAIARGLPREVAAIAHNGTERQPELTTQTELQSAIRAVLAQIDSDPALLFGYAVSVDAHGDGSPASVSRGNGLSGIRLPGAASDRAFAIWCGPGQCDLVEMRI